MRRTALSVSVSGRGEVGIPKHRKSNPTQNSTSKNSPESHLLDWLIPRFNFLLNLNRFRIFVHWIQERRPALLGGITALALAIVLAVASVVVRSCRRSALALVLARGPCRSSWQGWRWALAGVGAGRCLHPIELRAVPPTNPVIAAVIARPAIRDFPNIDAPHRTEIGQKATHRGNSPRVAISRRFKALRPHAIPRILEFAAIYPALRAPVNG